MATVLELQEQRASLTARMRALIEAAEAESRDFTAEEDTHWRTINDDITALDHRIDRAQVLERTPRETRPAPNEPEPRVVGRESEEYRAAFSAWLRHGPGGGPSGDPGITPEQRTILHSGGVESRIMGVSTPSAGGYFVAPEFERRIEQAMLWFGGMREVATIVPTSDGADFAFPTSDDTSNTGERLAEGATIGTQDASIGQRILKAYMYSSKLVRVSYQLLQDSAFDVESWLAALLGERIGRIQNTDFTLGTGANSPQGIMTNSVQGRAGAVGTSTSVTWDDLLLLEHSVDIAYRRNPGVRWMFHDQTLRDIRRIKDGDGQYLWQPGVGAGAPNVISGYGYVINNDMATMAASANSIVFGDMSKYLIRVVRGIQMVRLEELYAATLQVGFFAFARADGLLINAGQNPVKHFTNSAT